MNRKLLGFFAMMALAAGCLSTTAAESDNEAELDNEDCPDVEPEFDPEFDCTNANTPAGSNATPWFNKNYRDKDERWKLSRSMLDEHIPQGLATWKNYNNIPCNNMLVYTAYSQFGGPARIQGINEDNGSRTNYAEIGEGHAGGVAIIGQWAFVSGPNKPPRIYRYRLSELAAVFAGSTAPLHGVLVPVAANSFLASSEGHEGHVLYAGKFRKCRLGTMQPYRVDPITGELTAIVGIAIQVPKKTQGLTVLPNYFIYSTSWGRDNRSNVYVVKRDYVTLQAAYDDHNLRCVRIPSMAEGVTLSNNWVYQLFESGADCYANNEDECFSEKDGKPDRVLRYLFRTSRRALVDGLPVLH